VAGIAFAAVVGLISWYVIRAAITSVPSQPSTAPDLPVIQPSPVVVTKDIKSNSANPDSPKVLIETGERLAKAGRYREAMDSFRRALKLKPEDPLTMNDLAIVTADLGDSSLRGNEFAVAEQAYKIALQVWKHDARIHSQLGDAHNSLRQYERAIREYTEAINLGQHTADAYCKLGAAYYRTGKYDDARLLYLIAIEIDERHKPAYVGLGQTYLKLKQKDAARKIQQKLQSLD
jgi:tetratricopeptide (TPR) repeat protein